MSECQNCAKLERKVLLQRAMLATNPWSRVTDLESALTAIVGIPHKLDGGDWDEIEEAQKIALAAIAKAGGA